jgi:subtilisin family serine protease
MLAEGVDRPLEAIEILVAERYVAQPNYAMFVHGGGGCGSPCPPHPADVQQFVESGLFANPMKANPMKANPMKANPMKANPMKANHPMENSAVPADARRFDDRVLTGPGPHPHIVVLDTGLAGQTVASAATPSVDHRAPFLVAAAARISGAPDLPDVTIPLPGGGSAPADRYLDPAAGHGTFIAGIIEQLAPGCTIDVRWVINPLGDTDQRKVGDAIHDVVDDVEGGSLPRPVILSLSFGGPAPERPGYLREAVARAIAAGIPVIASAGNDGVCTPQYPAAFTGVIAVAALGPDGPPRWTNYGDWVDACAPGVDLVSTFFDRFDGNFPTINSYDPDCFTGWAEWSGTSFAAPVVVAAVARELVCGRSATGSNLDAVKAVDRVVRAPHLTRLPCLGTVINI